VALSAQQIKENFTVIQEEVEQSGGLKSMKMARLKGAVGAGRLDDGPLRIIEHHLRKHGLESTELGRSQNNFVLIYDPTTAFGKLIRAAKGDAEDSDRQLRDAAGELAADPSGLGAGRHAEENEELRDTLRQVHALVADYVE